MSSKRMDMEHSLFKLMDLLHKLRVKWHQENDATGRRVRITFDGRSWFSQYQLEPYLAKMIKLQYRGDHSKPTYDSF